MSQRKPIIRIRDLNKSYGDLHVLRGLTLDVATGEKVAIIGPSGSGKSTLLRLLMTLEEPDSGDVEVDGVSVWTVEKNGQKFPADESHLRQVRGKLGMVFQHFNLFPHMSMVRNLTTAPRLVRENRRRIQKRTRSSFWRWWDLKTRPMRIPRSFPGARNSASRLPEHWRWSRGSCCSTKSHQHWTRNSWMKSWVSFASWLMKRT